MLARSTGLILRTLQVPLWGAPGSHISVAHLRKGGVRNENQGGQNHGDVNGLFVLVSEVWLAFHRRSYWITELSTLECW